VPELIARVLVPFQPQPEIPVDIVSSRRRLARSPFWWRPCRL